MAPCKTVVFPVPNERIEISKDRINKTIDL
jgi:hypothetical protein